MKNRSTIEEERGKISCNKQAPRHGLQISNTVSFRDNIISLLEETFKDKMNWHLENWWARWKEHDLYSAK